MSDLLFPLADAPAMTPAQRREFIRKNTPAKLKGLHASIPGTGPAGETCGTCANLIHKRMAKTYIKCGLTRAMWTGGAGTDVRAKDPACSKWERRA